MKISRRQFYEIQALAERIQKNRHQEGDLETFAKFSEEFKSYLLNMTENEMVLERLEKLPRIEFKEFRPSLMEYLRLNGLSYLWNQKNKRKEILQKVREIASTYASIQFLMSDK